MQTHVGVSFSGSYILLSNIFFFNYGILNRSGQIRPISSRESAHLREGLASSPLSLRLVTNQQGAFLPVSGAGGQGLADVSPDERGKELLRYCCQRVTFALRLYVNWRFMRGIEAQFLALQKGFNELIPQHLLKPFDQKELEVGHAGLGCEGLLCAGWSLPPGQATDEAAQSPQAWGSPWLQEQRQGWGTGASGSPEQG